MKALVFVAITLLCLLMALVIPLRVALLQSYAAFEQNAVREDVEHAQGSLAAGVGMLKGTVLDYGTWTASYDFIAGERPTFPAEDMTTVALAAREVSFAAYIHPSGRVFYSRAVNLNDNTEQAVVSVLRSGTLLDPRLLAAVSAAEGAGGVVMLNNTPFLVASRPVLRSDGSGPSRGTVLMGRVLDGTQVRRLSQNHVVFSVQHSATVTDSEMEEALAQLLAGEEILVEPRNDDTIDGYTLQRDIFGQPELLLELSRTREIMRQGKNSLFYFTTAMIVAGIVFGAVLLLLIERLFLRRIVRLSGAVQQIGERSDLAARIPSCPSGDEIGRLVSSMNSTMSALERSERDREGAEAARAQAQEALARSKEQLFHMIVHDLKNPLTGLLGYVDMMQFLPPGPAQAELLAGAKRSGTTLMGLVNDVLDIARLEEGRLDVRRQPCDVAELLRACCDEMHLWAAQEQKALSLDLPLDAETVLLDRSLMRRVVVNLLSNAIKHTPLATPIELGFYADAEGWRIWVHDAGPGIPAERQHKIFERFNSTSAAPTSQSSTGLGLAFCALAVKAHGATLQLESGPERGTTFTICATH